MKDNHPVFKIGRTTGTTIGRVHGSKVNVRTEYSTDEGTVVVHSCEVVVFTSITQARGVFSDPGDSGAAVYDGNANLVGTLWGGWPFKRASGGQMDSIHCVTPIEATEEHIRRHLDGTLEFL
jgi:hypothetical protein